MNAENRETEAMQYFYWSLIAGTMYRIFIYPDGRAELVTKELHERAAGFGCLRSLVRMLLGWTMGELPAVTTRIVKRLSQGEVEEIVQKLEDAGFFSMRERYVNACAEDGFMDSLSVKWQGRSRTVKRDNDIANSDYDEVIRCITSIFEEEIRRL